MANNDLFSNMGLSDMSYLLDPHADDQGQGESSQNKPQTLNIDDLIPFKNHPFHVDVESESFLQLVDSIREYGIIYPIKVRPVGDKYEIVSGHCRVRAAKEVGITSVPADVQEMTDFEATIYMVHTNINGRDHFLISEKAKAYRMCMDAEKHQGKRGMDTAVMVGNGQDSRRSVYRYVRLSYLLDPLLELVDTSKLSVATALEVAYLDEQSQAELYKYIERTGKLPSTEQASKLRSIYKEKKEPLSYECIVAELTEVPKAKAATRVSFKTKDIASYFEPETDAEEMTNVILMLLSKYHNGEFGDILGDEV